MSCQETRELIHGYVDREVDLVKSLEIQEHLSGCLACSQTYNGIRNLRSTLSDNALRFEPPAGFERRLRSALRSKTNSEPSRSSFNWKWIVAVTSFAAAAILIWVTAIVFLRPSARDMVAQEIVSSHVRSLMADHLTDVPSSDQHTVKPWFHGKLDFAPPVKDLSQQGFNLNGGRLDYIGNRPVAALVYQRRQHLINLFVWPATNGRDVGQQASIRQGYNLIGWTIAGMTYWAISDVNLAELQEFVQLLQQQNQARLQATRSSTDYADCTDSAQIVGCNSSHVLKICVLSAICG